MFTPSVVCVWIVRGNFLYEKQSLIGLPKVIGLQNEINVFNFTLKFKKNIYKSNLTCNKKATIDKCDFKECELQRWFYINL